MTTQVREGDWVRLPVGMDGIGRVVEVDDTRGCVEVVMQDGRGVRLGAEWVIPVDFEAEAETIMGDDYPSAMPEVALVAPTIWHLVLLMAVAGGIGGAIVSLIAWFLTRGS